MKFEIVMLNFLVTHVSDVYFFKREQYVLQKNQTTQAISRKETMPPLYGTTVLLIDRRSSSTSSGQYPSLRSLQTWWQSIKMVTE